MTLNATLMLVGDHARLTVTMFDRMRQGSTPLLDAVSLLPTAGLAVLGPISILAQRSRRG